MHKLRRVSLLLALGCVPMAALAQSAPDPIDACMQVSDANARLTCFDRAARQRHPAVTTAATAASPVAPAPAPIAPITHLATASVPAAPPAPHTAPDNTIGLDGKQLAAARAKEGIQPTVIPHISAAVNRVQARPGHQYHFELDNGQVWESTDSQPALFLSPHETVTIRPGVFGAFFLKTQAGLSIRVHRLE